MLQISTTINEVVYTIGADDFGGFVAAVKEVEGLFGLHQAVQELTHQVAEAAVAPIAAQGPPGGSETHADASDELADLIRQAPDSNSLVALWRAHKDEWTGEYNKLADKRKKELEKEAK